MSQIVSISDKVERMIAAGERVIQLEHGDPDFPTPEGIISGAVKALEDGFTHYAPSRGYLEVRQAVAEKLRIENSIAADPESEIHITQGSTHGLFLAVMSSVSRGEEVLVTDPGYLIYPSLIRMAGGMVKTIPTNEESNWTIDEEVLKESITPSTKAVIINSPANPTGTVLDKSTLKILSDTAMDRDFTVISDEAYESLVYDGKRHVSIASLPGLNEHVVSLFTLSKTYAMTGWRIGYMASTKEIINKANDIHNSVLAHVTSHVQMAVPTALKTPKSATDAMRDQYDIRRRKLAEGLNEIDGFECPYPDGSFYLFPSIKKFGLSSAEFCYQLLEKAKVAAVPGTAFGTRGEGYVRLSYSRTDLAEIQEALERIRKFAESRRQA